MLLRPKQADSSWFQSFILVLNLAWLLSFDRNKYVSAIYADSPNLRGGPDDRWSYYGPDNRFQGPDFTDYPINAVIRANFLGTETRQTMTMLVSPIFLVSYGEFCKREDLNLKCPPIAFQRGFLRLGSRSRKWWRDFYVRFNDVYIDGAVGDVYILVDDPRAMLVDPSQRPGCRYFNVMVHRFKLNRNVMSIILVSARFAGPEPGVEWWPTPNWDNQEILWQRGDESDRTEATRDDGPVGGGGAGNNILGAAAPLIAPLTLGGPFGVLGATADSTGLLNSLKSTAVQGLPSLFGDGKDQDPGVKIDPTWTDVLPSSPMASLPDGNTVDTNRKFSLADATTPLEPQTDGKSSGTESGSGSTSAFDNSGLKISDTFNTDDPTTDKATLADKSLIQRRRWRALHQRDSTTCLDWLTDSDFPDTLDQLDKAVVPSPNPLTPPVLHTDDNIEKLFVSEEVATLLITQHINPSMLDVRVSTSTDEILNQQGISAPVGVEIPVPVRWKVTTPNSNVLTVPVISWPLYITVKSTDPNAKDSIEIKYGAVLLILDLGTKFDSGDKSRCSVGAWTGSARQIQCAIDVGH